MRIAVVAPSCPLKPEAASRLESHLAGRTDVAIIIHPQCFLSNGHFAGSDQARLDALLEVMADPSIDAVWFARGGYGSNRIAQAALAGVCDAARAKTYLGYSDAGFLLAAFCTAGLDVAWGPMPQDIVRAGGEAAIQRALDWLVRRGREGLEPSIEEPAMAFNLTVLSNLLGTPLEPNFEGVDLLIEEVSEQLYRIDRTLFHVTSSPNIQKVSRIRLGRVSDVLANEPEFGRESQAIVEDWCDRSGVRFGGKADIGHDIENKIVPFGSRIRPNSPL